MTQPWTSLFIDTAKDHNQKVRINEIFDHVYFINLDSRTDRLDHIQDQLHQLDISATRVAGVKTEEIDNLSTISLGQLGCLLSHRFILEDARNHSYKSVLILEDDIVFKSPEISDLETYMSNLPKDWDMLYLCGNNYSGLSKVTENIFRTFGTLSTAAYAVNSKIYDQLLSILSVESPKKPIDSYYLDQHPHIKAYVCVPSLAFQRPDFSDIEHRFVDYSFLK